MATRRGEWVPFDPSHHQCISKIKNQLPPSSPTSVGVAAAMQHSPGLTHSIPNGSLNIISPSFQAFHQTFDRGNCYAHRITKESMWKSLCGASREWGRGIPSATGWSFGRGTNKSRFSSIIACSVVMQFLYSRIRYLTAKRRGISAASKASLSMMSQPPITPVIRSEDILSQSSILHYPKRTIACHCTAIPWHSSYGTRTDKTTPHNHPNTGIT